MRIFGVYSDGVRIYCCASAMRVPPSYVFLRKTDWSKPPAPPIRGISHLPGAVPTGLYTCIALGFCDICTLRVHIYCCASAFLSMDAAERSPEGSVATGYWQSPGNTSSGGTTVRVRCAKPCIWAFSVETGLPVSEVPAKVAFTGRARYLQPCQ